MIRKSIPASGYMQRYGRALRFHTQFKPAGTNVNFVHVRDPRHMTVRTYERGVEGEEIVDTHRERDVDPHEKKCVDTHNLSMSCSQIWNFDLQCGLLRYS